MSEKSLEPIYCGSMNIQDYIIQSEPQTEDSTLPAIKNAIRSGYTNNISPVIAKYVVPKMIDNYKKVDINFLNISESYDWGKYGKVMLPRFTAINLSKGLEHNIKLGFAHSELGTDANFRAIFTHGEPDKLECILVRCITGIEPETWIKENSINEGYIYSVERKKDKEILKTYFNNNRHHQDFDIIKNINFSIPLTAIKDMCDASEIMPNSKQYLIVDNSRIGWNIKIRDGVLWRRANTWKYLEEFKDIKHHTNALIIAENANEYYLITQFQPEYNNEVKSEESNNDVIKNKELDNEDVKKEELR